MSVYKVQKREKVKGRKVKGGSYVDLVPNLFREA